MIVLALDLGNRCGWSLFDTGQHIGSGVWTLQSDRQRRFEGAGMKWLRLGLCLDEILRTRLPQKVAVEEVRAHAGTDAAHAYGGALATVTMWCERHGIPYEGIPVATVKRHATGKGNAKKDAMLAAARARWSFLTIEDDNHADALWIGDYAGRVTAP